MTTELKKEQLLEEIKKLKEQLRVQNESTDAESASIVHTTSEMSKKNLKKTKQTPNLSEVLDHGEKIDAVEEETKKKESEKDLKNRLPIINLETNEDSVISRFWSIEPGSRQGIRIRLFRNGDKFFPGMEYAVCHTKCRTLSYLLDQLNNSSIRDPNCLPYGVRFIFNLQGQKIKKVIELRDGGIYVVSSSTNFIKIDYLSLTSKREWRCGSAKNKVLSTSASEHNKLEVKRLDAIQITTSEDRLAGIEKKPLVSEMKKSAMIYVVKNDVLRPRKIIRWLLSPKTSGSLERVLAALSERFNSGCLVKLHSSDGTEIMCTDDLYLKANQVFFGFGKEQVKRSDFTLKKEEINMIQELTKKTGGQHTDKVLIIPFVPNDPEKPVLLENFRLSDDILCTNENKVSLRMCKDLKTNTNYILKIFDVRTLTKAQELKVRREMKIMRMIKHTNLVYADTITFDDNFSCMYIKKFPKCSLAEVLLNDNHYHCERFVSDVIMQISKGLEYLASYQIVNRNVTLESVVADITFSGLVQFKLCDFGLARKIKSLDKKLYLICGNPCYIAPEMLVEEGYDTKVDIWSLGILMYILLVGEYPFRGADLNDCNAIFSKVSEGCVDMTSNPVWDIISTEAKNLLLCLLESDPNKRFTAQKIQAHQWTSQSSTFAPEKDLRAHLKKKLYDHIVEQEVMSLDCLEVLCLSCVDKDPFYFVNTVHCGEEEEDKNDVTIVEDN